jgi:hypothetical protein
MDHAQLELFADRPPTQSDTVSAAARRLVPEDLSDAALIADLPDATLADARALAAEAGRRGLGDAVRSLVALCSRFVGFGADCRVPEQIAAWRRRTHCTRHVLAGAHGASGGRQLTEGLSIVPRLSIQSIMTRNARPMLPT